MKRGTLRAIIMLLCGLILAACSEYPPKNYGYAGVDPTKGWEIGDSFNFEIEIDTTGVSEIYLTAKIKSSYINPVESSVPVIVTFSSRSGKHRDYKIELPLNVVKDRGKYIESGDAVEIEWIIIKNIVNRDGLLWSVNVSQDGILDVYENIIGIGVRSKKIDNERKG